MMQLPLEVLNDLSEVARVIGLVEAFAEDHDVPPRVASQFLLALDELITNVVKYAWVEGGKHSFAVSIKLTADRIAAEIVDDGTAYNPLDVPTPDLDADLDHRRIGGLGVHIVRRTMDEFTYKRVGGKNRQFIAKTIPKQESKR